MSEQRLISPLLDGFALGGSISEHSGVTCYPAMRNDSDERFIVKTISIPASQVQVDALLLTGAFPNAAAAAGYFEDLARGIQSEVEILNKLSKQRGFLPYHSFQIVPKEEGVGFDVWLLSPYELTLERYLKRSPMTHLSAINLGIDLCAAMVVCREAGYLYVDLKPGNIFLPGHQDYRIGDLGFIRLDSLKYASLPDRYRSAYTPPEVTDAYSTLNDTMDTYALGLVLYQIYNNGQLPFDSDEGRQELMARLAAGESLPAPANADYEMAQIIEKACAYAPENRWASPMDMGHALISYMQRNGANDVPIVPPVIEEQEAPEEEPKELIETTDEGAEAPEQNDEQFSAESDEAPAEETADKPAEELSEEASEELTVEEPPAKTEEADTESPEEVPEAVSEEEPAAEEEPQLPEEPTEADAPDEEPDAPEGDWIDVMDAILSEDSTDEGSDQADEDEPSLRELLETDEIDNETAAEVDTEELTDDTADMLSLAQELIEHDAPAPVVAPEPIEVPIPEPIVLEEDTPEEPAQTDEDADPQDTAVIPASENTGDTQIIPEIPEQPQTPAAEDEPKKPSRLKKAIGWIAAILVAALLGAGAYYYYQNYYLQRIDSMSVQGLENQLTVTVQTEMDQSLLTVICKDTYGNSLPGKLENGSVTFTDLLPGTQYIITLEVDGFHQLVNAAPATYSTPAETKLINITTVTGQEDGSVILSFGVEGADSDSWTLSWTADGEEEKFMDFSGHTVTVTGLTVGSTYTFTLDAPEEIYLVGENTITHTASQMVTAENLTVSGYSDGSITASWTAPEGVTVDRWIARCYNEDGYDQILEVTEPSATFTDITANAAYTLEVTAVGMTLGTRTFVTANPITITGITAQAADGGIQVDWTFDGQAPAGGWVVLFTADSGTWQQVVNAEEASAVLEHAAPGSHYDIVIQTPDATSIFGGSASVDVLDGSAFSAYGLDTSEISVDTYLVPEKNSWGSSDLRRSESTSTFSPNGSMALLYSTRYRYNIDYTTLTTLFVIRDAEGKLVSIDSSARTWADMWYNGYCVETVKNLPAEPGSYSLTVYIGGMKLTIQDFTIE